MLHFPCAYGVKLVINHMTDHPTAGEFSGKRIALGITGGIAAYKAAEILRGLQRAGCEVRVAMTQRACEFITPLTFRALSGSHVVVDDYAPDNPDPIAHITFSQTVDLFLVAPATANVIAKFANGIADDFLTSTYLACTAPIVIAPAMNTTMWNHPATQRNIQRLRADGVQVIEPDSGEMACGTFGPGRLSEPELVVAAALEILRDRVRHQSQDMSGERVLITTGATREELDPVRFLSNRSSGRMGFALAEAARSRGADVTVIAGATTVEPPANIETMRAISAGEMRAAVMGQISNATVFISAAAVADYRPTTRAPNKVKKSHANLTLALEPTPDILAEVASGRQNGLLVIGFAAESENVIQHARSKLDRKRLDAIVVNDITRAGAGFDSTTNIVSILTRFDEAPIEVGLMSKLDAAHRVLDEVLVLRGSISQDKLCAEQSS